MEAAASLPVRLGLRRASVQCCPNHASPNLRELSFDPANVVSHMVSPCTKASPCSPRQVPWHIRQAWQHQQTHSANRGLSLPLTGPQAANAKDQCLRLLYHTGNGMELSGEWSNSHWHFFHRVDKWASIMIMPRRTLIHSARISTAVPLPGRCIQIQFHLHRPYDISIRMERQRMEEG